MWWATAMGRAVEDVEDLLFLFFGDDSGLVDEGEDDPGGSDAGGDGDEVVEVLFAGCALGLRAADEGEVHEPVAAEGGSGDVVLAFEGVERGEAFGGEDRVGVEVVVVVDPLDVVEAGGAGAGELFTPGGAGEGLEAAVFWGAEAALHDAVGVGHGGSLRRSNE
jgi:hypothetical protein